LDLVEGFHFYQEQEIGLVLGCISPHCPGLARHFEKRGDRALIPFHESNALYKDSTPFLVGMGKTPRIAIAGFRSSFLMPTPPELNVMNNDITSNP
jgi:hypothetical protein